MTDPGAPLSDFVAWLKGIWLGGLFQGWFQTPAFRAEARKVVKGIRVSSKAGSHLGC